ncbi:methyltransferase domain-containing protein [Patescibacteria group bacterium]|nr:methyltransferase domain-containing protein [Patescibacteria group bacterium]
MKINGFNDTIDWYSKNANHYAQSIKNREFIDAINEFTRLILKEGRVLDAGCAAGRDTNLLSDKGLVVVGIDLSKELLELAKKSYPTLKFIEGDFRNLPFEDNYFDGIWANASLLHFETIQQVTKAIKEFYRVMKKGGVIHVSVKAQTGKDKTAVVSDSLSKHDRFFQFFKEGEVKDLLIKNYFEIIKLKQYRETDIIPNGRFEVEWILALARKK